MSLMVAPEKLPFAPRPYSTELLSSWLLRVAAANLVSLRELLDGFESRYGRILSNELIDYGIPHEAVAALAQFCRVTPAGVRALDLRERAPHLTPALLLRFHSTSLVWCPRCSLRRVRYAFCPLCLASQHAIYARWDWSVACFIRCAFHRTRLMDGCPECGELDPLTFSGFDPFPIRACRSCQEDLSANRDSTEEVRPKGNIQAVEEAYRSMLLGIAPDPSLVGKATDRAFRQFVEDMFQLLTRSLNPWDAWIRSEVPFLRKDVLQIVTALVENAAPSADRRIRCRRYSQGLVLWATLLGTISDTGGEALEQSSLRWPVSLRRRFVSALYRRKGKRWPCSPYGTNLSMRTERRKIAAVFSLRPPLQAPVQHVSAGLGGL